MRTIVVAVLVATTAGCSAKKSAAPAPTAVPVPAATATVPVPVPVPAPTAAPRPVDLATLPALAIPAGVIAEAKPVAVVLHAAAASADVLVTQLASPGRAFLALATGKQVTGTVSAPSREAALAAVLGAVPTVGAPVTTPPLRRKGRHVDLRFGAVDPRLIFRLLADVQRVNLVVAPGDLPKLDLAVDEMPADEVVARLADLLDRDLVVEPATWFLLPRGGRPPVLAGRRGEGVVVLEIHGAHASDALRALHALAPQAVHLACGEGPALDLALRASPTEEVRALAVASGLALAQGEPDCPASPTPHGAPPAALPLRVIALRGAEGTALLGDGDAAWLERASRDVAIRRGEVRFAGEADPRPLYSVASDDATPVGVDPPGPSWRLAATAVLGDRSFAVLADPAAEVPMILGAKDLRFGAQPIEIAPGTVTIGDWRRALSAP